MSKSSKILYASGCSFTQKDWVITDINRMEGYETGPHPMWPEILAKKLQLKEVNHGLGGHGNDYIMQDSVRFILENHRDIELVCIQWSQITRIWVYDMGAYNPSVWLDEEKHRSYGKDKYDTGDFVGFPNIFGDRFHVAKALMKHVLRDQWTVIDLYKKFLREILTLQKLCEELNVKYIMGQGCTSHQLNRWRLINPDLDWDAVLKHLIEHPDFYAVNNKTFMGWPCFPELGGKTMTDDHEDFTPNPKNRINPIDFHPSAYGQELFAEQFYKKYLELYG